MFRGYPIQHTEGEPLSATFARVLCEVFAGEAWNDVEPHARRAWDAITPILGPAIPWEDVHDDIRRDFGA